MFPPRKVEKSIGEFFIIFFFDIFVMTNNLHMPKDEIKVLVKKIKENEKLLEFNRKILNINVILNNDNLRYLYMVSLISSDNIIDIASCDKSLESINFILNNIDLFDIDDKVRKEVVKYLKKGLRIIKRDRKTFIESLKKEKNDNEFV